MKKKAEAFKMAAFLMDGLFLLVILFASLATLYFSIKVLGFLGRDIFPMSLKKFSFLVVPTGLVFIIPRYVYIYFLKGRIPIIRNYGFWKSRNRPPRKKPVL